MITRSKWGSKRTGPDLARVGGRYSNEWHLDHLIDPQSVVPESIMPSYKFLLKKRLRPEAIAKVMQVHRLVGVPYTDEQLAAAAEDMRVQVLSDGDWEEMLKRYPGAVIGNFDGQDKLTEMDALIAYLQVLGTMVDFSTFTPDSNR